ncbi:MAG TPA: MFS transporter [Ignavibacteria bacterium]|nr:MFS transporter [Ignavibacteria bacterium]HRB01591.1 MFS transporter [Ignavibacteria bacterium]
MENWKKNLYSIWIAQFVAMAGMSMVIPFLPFYIRELGVTEIHELEFWSGLVFSGPFILSFILTPVWGMLGDRFGKKTMVMRAIFGLALSQLLIGFSADVYQLFIFRMVQGGISGFIASSLALVSSSTPKEKSGYAIGILQTSISSGTVIGPFIGGIISDMTSYKTVFFVTSALCIVSGLLVLINVKEPPKQISSRRFTLSDNYKYVFSRSFLLISMLSILFLQISITVAQPVFALFVESITTGTEYLSTLTGAIFATLGVFSVISSPWWGKRNDTKSFKKNIIIAITGAGIAYCLHSFVYDPYMLFPVRAFLGLCVGGIIPVIYANINKYISDERKSGIMGIASSFTLLGNLLGPLICTALLFKIDMRYIFLIAGIMLFVNAFIIYIKVKEFPKSKEFLLDGTGVNFKEIHNSDIDQNLPKNN